MKEKTYDIAPDMSAEERGQLNLFSDLTAKLLFRRGLRTNDAAQAFINVDYDAHTHDPFLLKDMDKVVDRILHAHETGEKICVYSDYDADGVPGAVVMNDFLKKIDFANFSIYIPHRNLEGFGLNDEAVRQIAGEGRTLIITIDCGIADVSQVELANSLGIEVIVTDHHECGAVLPPAYAIINPKQPGCAYPEKMLCGSGVIFKVIQALIIRGRERKLPGFTMPVGWEKWLLDMVGLATMSDMVPLSGENRVFAKFGLAVLRKSPRKGLVKLLKDAGVDQKNLSEEDVVFTITPRINAASRMGSPETAFRMLATDDEAEAGETVRHLHKINDERKGTVAAMVRDIKKFVDENLVDHGVASDSPTAPVKKLRVPVIVRGHTDWSPSLLGLAASSIVETYGCPVFLWGRGEGDELKGSCRSDGSASVVDMMTALPAGVLETFGGHLMAGGFVAAMTEIDRLEETLTEAYKKCLAGAVNNFEKQVDAALTIDDIEWRLHDELEKLSPFGAGNEKPSFLIRNARISDVSKFGKEKSHIKIIFQKGAPAGGSNYRRSNEVTAIQFFAGDNKKYANLKAGDSINFVAHVEKSTFGGRRELRLRIVDVL